LLKTRHGLEIRAPVSSDVPGLAELLGTGGHVIAPRTLADRLEVLRQEPCVVLIAAEWGPPSGLIIAHWYRTVFTDHPVARVTTLLVGPDARRRGIGRLLVKAAAQAARAAGCDVLELIAAAHEQDLHDFCRATGFIETGPRFVRALRRRSL
jgi:aminoglycoside 6'-N-acetyltransferase I